MGYLDRSMYGYPSKSYYLHNKYKKEFPNLSEDELAKKLGDNLSESDDEEYIIMREKAINDLKTGIKNCKDETGKEYLKSFLKLDELSLALLKGSKSMKKFLEEESNLK